MLIYLNYRVLMLYQTRKFPGPTHHTKLYNLARNDLSRLTCLFPVCWHSAYARISPTQVHSSIESDSIGFLYNGEHFSKLVWTTDRAITSLVDCDLNSIAKRLLDFEMEGTGDVDILRCERRLEDMSRDPKLCVWLSLSFMYTVI